jgi:hypothetical protein
MANLDAPFGFSPVGKIGGGTSPAMNSYSSLAAYGTAIFQGDPVKCVEAGGDVQLFAKGDGGTAATNCIGVFWGCNYDDSNGKPTFTNQKAASLATTCFVYDNPYQVFEIQGDAASAVTDRSKLGDIASTAGSTTTGVSKTEADSANWGTGANIKVVGFSTKEGRNDVGSANLVYEVLINEHKYK